MDDVPDCPRRRGDGQAVRLVRPGDRVDNGGKCRVEAPMSTVLEAPAAPAWLTVADLLKLLGDVPPERVRLRPTPGTATEADVLAVLDHENIPCELVEGTLVEKAMGYEESCLTTELIFFLVSFLK